jgi:uncharacterized protein YbjT (DUF2867 family)
MGAVLVTGATGNVGIEVAGQLLQRTVTVNAAVRGSSTTRVAEGAIPVEFDFQDESTFDSALDGVDRVFLMRPPHMSDAKAFRPFIQAMERSGVKQVAFLSVQGAGQNVFVPHHAIEVQLKRSSLSWTLLRPSFFMQNLTTTHLSEIRDRDEIYVPAGNGRTNFIDVADIGEVAALCLTTTGHERRAYEITGTEALTYAEVAQILTDALGRKITYRNPSAREFKARMKAGGHDDDFVKVMARIYAIAKIGMAAGTTDTFRTLVGRRPRTMAEWAATSATCWERAS